MPEDVCDDALTFLLAKYECGCLLPGEQVRLVCDRENFPRAKCFAFEVVPGNCAVEKCCNGHSRSVLDHKQKKSLRIADL